MRLLSKFTKLDSRGVSHLLLPLLVVAAVGVVGAYMVVGSHADAKPKKNTAKAASSTFKPNPKRGFIVIFNDNTTVVAKDAWVKVQNTTAKDHTCSGSGLSKSAGAQQFGSDFAVKLKTIKANSKTTFATPIQCDPIGGSAFYTVNYGYYSVGTATGVTVLNSAKTGASVVKSASVNVNVNAGYCTFVHPGGQVRIVADNANGCNGTDGEVTTPIWPDTMALTGLANKGKTITGYVDVRVANQDLGREACSGTVAINASNGKHSVNQSRPMTFAKDKFNGGNGRCVVKLSIPLQKNSGDWAGDWTIKANLSNSPYLQPSSASDTVKVVEP